MDLNGIKINSIDYGGIVLSPSGKWTFSLMINRIAIIADTALDTAAQAETQMLAECARMKQLHQV